MKTEIKYSMGATATGIAIVLGLMYLLGLWMSWVCWRLFALNGDAGLLAVFILIIIGVLPKRAAGAPVLCLSLATLYIWILL